MAQLYGHSLMLSIAIPKAKSHLKVAVNHSELPEKRNIGL